MCKIPPYVIQTSPSVSDDPKFEGERAKGMTATNIAKPGVTGANSQRWSIRHYEQKQPDLLFYDAYDTGFFTAKGSVLAKVIEHFDEAKEFFTPFGLYLEDKDKARFKLDLYFSEFQCFEALFALMMAPFQAEPHFIFMCKYNPRKLKEQLEAYLKGDIASITSGKIQTESDFMGESVYLGYKPDESPDKWPDNLDSLVWLFERLARRYVNALEYNSHKHGLRVFYNGPSSFGLSMTGHEEMMFRWESEDSIRFFEIDGTDPNLIVLNEVIKHFDLGENLHNLYLMEAMIETICTTRRAIRSPELKDFTIKDFRGVDKDNVNRFWARDFTYRIKIGERSP